MLVPVGLGVDRLSLHRLRFLSCDPAEPPLPEDTPVPFLALGPRDFLAPFVRTLIYHGVVDTFPMH
jgi:hypothetical protein